MGLDLTAVTRSQKRIVSACRALAKGLTSSVPACILYIAVYTSMWRCCDDPFHGWANFRMPVPTNGQCFWMCWSCWLLFRPLEKRSDFACKSRRGSRPTGSISPNTSSTNVFNTRLFLKEDSFMKLSLVQPAHLSWNLNVWLQDHIWTKPWTQGLLWNYFSAWQVQEGKWIHLLNGNFIIFRVSGLENHLSSCTVCCMLFLLAGNTVLCRSSVLQVLQRLLGQRSQRLSSWKTKQIGTCPTSF